MHCPSHCQNEAADTNIESKKKESHSNRQQPLLVLTQSLFFLLAFQLKMFDTIECKNKYIEAEMATKARRAQGAPNKARRS